MNVKKLTNEEVDKRLEGREIKRVSNVIGSHKKSKFICLIESCGYLWSSIVGDILNKSVGCPKCANKLRLTNEIVDFRLKDRNIQRISNVINSKNKYNWKCLIKNWKNI